MKTSEEKPKQAKISLCITAGLFIMISVCTFVITIQTAVGTTGSLHEKLTAVSETAVDEISSRIFLRDFCLDYSGLFSRLAGIRHVEKAFKLDNGQLTQRNAMTDITPAAEAVCELNRFCQDNGTPFLYINPPHKPLYDQDLGQYGINSCTNQNEDKLLRALADEGVDCLDLRGPLYESSSDPYHYFYRTDHHWTAEAGLFTAGVIAREIRTRYGLSTDADILDPAGFETIRYKNCFLGEMGKKTGAAYAFPEDLIIIQPRFPTHLSFRDPSRQIDMTGDFSILLNTALLQKIQAEASPSGNGFPWAPSVYDDNLYYTYMYGNSSLQQIHNEDAAGGRILVVKDSFAQVVNPYLALSVRDLDCWDVRQKTGSLRDQIRENDYDLVIVMYTGSMLNRPKLVYNFE